MAFVATWCSFRQSRPLLLRGHRVLRTSSVLKKPGRGSHRPWRGGGQAKAVASTAFATRAKFFKTHFPSVAEPAVSGSALRRTFRHGGAAGDRIVIAALRGRRESARYSIA